MTKVRFEVGNKWRLGPDWPGQRCGAKTRKSTPCQRPAKLHGGVSYGPKTKGGLVRLTATRTTHGRFAKEKRAEAKWRAEVGRRPNIPLNRTVHKKSIAVTRSAIVWGGTTGLVSKDDPSICLVA